MSEQHKFRYLLPPGNNFQFVAKFKFWLVLSMVLMAASVGALFVNKAVRGEYMNWTIDFRGGTEIHYAFKDQATGKYIAVDPGKIRSALEKAGESGFDVSDIKFPVKGQGDELISVEGKIVRTPRFGALSHEDAQKAAEKFSEVFKDRDVSKATWSGDRLSVRSKKPITNAEAAAMFKTLGLDVKPWTAEEIPLYTTPDEGTHEYNQWYSLWGIDRQYEQILEKALPGVDIEVAQSYGVGAKAGDKLRDDALKSLIYAIFLIMLYLAFRFDIRYAPGAAFATIHDAVMVIGVFAITFTEVSLTSVAGLLTVVSFSVNDTVVIFDRIRENQAKLKDKKLERVIDISINEVLVRSILTSSTVFATTLIMNIFGTGLVQNFAFAMNIGVIVGSYSSLFLAPPFFLWISKKWYSGPAPARRRGQPAGPERIVEKAAPEAEPGAGDGE
ncbi:MAG TPA: protein translocase subunit SecF [Kofleriaceae bacterium]|nr:protein translocase subunit SecF [Kofleriaceae bacterium]